MKIAIVCDWLVTIGGAEKVLSEIIQCFPEADLFAVIDFLDDDKRNFLQDKSIQTTFIQKLPFAKTNYRHYLPFMPLAIEQLDLSNYDLIISSSHAVAKGVITGPNQLHISYVHTPMRYIWDLQHQYLRESGLDKKISGLIARYCLHKLRLWDVRSANGVDHFIANSQFIAHRILKTYRRTAEVIYPPIDISTFIPHQQKENFYITASRLVPYKKIDLIVESFRFMPNKKLIVIGDGPDATKIKSKAGINVELLGYQSDKILISYLQRAKAFIFAAEEDFGMLPVEAQACGTPVIAYGRGGALETIRHPEQENPTGLFFYEPSVAAICQTIQAFENNQHCFTINNCVENAKRFSAEEFRKKLKSFISSKN
ncbi:MAG: glycosyl transferase family 1 [Gammaproteobacteria bacterium RIFCSPHIGHO2_12_FULL_37_14]|nr:MAG: glycosyl transferase family 1 [Gammaproteobacteria bacterium RIFCSPHIGHO2_12_FULL_37_14]